MKRWILGLTAAAAVLFSPALVGCGFHIFRAANSMDAEAVAKAAAEKGIKTLLVYQDRPDLVFLNIAGCLCMGLAVVGTVLCFVRPGIISVWSVVGLAVTGVACWTLRDVLQNYLWVLKLAGTAGLIIAGMAFAYGHRNWIESRLNLDLNRDGKIGDDPAEHPGAVS